MNVARLGRVLAGGVLAACAGTTDPGPSRDVDQIFILPQQAMVVPNQTMQFLSFGRTRAGDTVPVDVTWSATAGTIEPDGRYTAAATAGDHQVMASHPANSLLADTSVVSVSTTTDFRLVLAPDTVTMDASDSVDFLAVGLTPGGDTILVPVQWSVSEGSIEAQGNGPAVGRFKPGRRSKNQRVVATDATGTRADTTSVTVLQLPAASVEVQPDPVTVQAGATVQLVGTARDSAGNPIDGKTFQWSSTNAIVATVDANGTLTGVATGSTFVTATADGATAATAVTVSAVPVAPVPVASVTVAPASVSLTVGQTQQVTATLRDAAGNVLTGRAVTWSSSQTAWATVSGSGLVTAVGAGTATIAATSEGRSGTASVTVAGSFQSYTTNFDANENPISEGGRWVHRDTTLTVVQTTGGVAYGTQTGSGYYDDSNAYLPGFGNDYSIEGTVYLKPGTPSTPNREVELLLRWTDDNPPRSTSYGTTSALGYEININQNGDYMILGRFKGAELTRAASPPVPASGDKFKAVIQGQTIIVYWNGTEKFRYTDNDATSKITSGNPGIGFFIRSGASNTDFGFTALTVTALP